MNVELPDGSKREVPDNATVLDVAGAIGKRLQKDAIAGKVDGKVVDVYAHVPDGAKVEIVTPKSAEGLDTIRHSTAHLMAMAVQELFPGTQVTIGPVIEHGFYYDFATDRPFSDDDLRRIEEKMSEIVARDLPIKREEWSRDEAIKVFDGVGEKFKVEIIREIPGNETLSVYRQGAWFDLCRGPHVPSTGRLGAFKLTHVAGAYWRGDERNQMLQRIYGTAWADKEQLDAHLKQVEEARARDHRKLGRELGLIYFSHFAPAMPNFLPKGAVIYNELIDFVREYYRREGYSEVVTPLVSDAVWDAAESALERALKKNGLAYHINPGEGAFYGPKLEYQVTDAIGRPWQLGTVQVDYNLPERFKLEYIGADNAEHRPVMIHRAILGSLERFIGIIIEHFAGAFPFWLAPVQAIVLPLSEKFTDYGREVLAKLKAANIRAEIDESNEKLGAKIRNAQLQKVPFMLVVGEKEAASGSVALRERHGEQSTMSVEALVEKARELIRTRALTPEK